MRPHVKKNLLDGDRSMSVKFRVESKKHPNLNSRMVKIFKKVLISFYTNEGLVFMMAMTQDAQPLPKQMTTVEVKLAEVEPAS
ncbi:hypothetical protein NQ317_001825 [Molorchus minor]|uniref:Uncharacterized protein n=1 Tax=Molorchus minor TaxID=1323400 RepID=A0ABQ9J7Y4_9CUCU|nr:hypothetical protein NQ317_001825 [Molorchus minor]